MKSSFIFVGLLSLVGLLSTCTISTLTTTAGKGRVIILANGAQKGPKVALAKSAKMSHSALLRTARGQRSAHPGFARDLNATSDIQPNGLTYTLKDQTNPGDPTEATNQIIDLTTLEVDLTLNPNDTYVISVNVAITASAPGAAVGVTTYGDQTSFTVDPNYDTYVDLTVHPTGVKVFDPASLTKSGGNIYISQKYPTAASVQFIKGTNLNGNPVSVSPADKLFYSPDAKLFYFNKAANQIYQWKDITKAIDPIADLIVDPTNSLGLDSSSTIYAAASDPTTLDLLWVVYKSGATWHYNTIDLSSGTAEASLSPSSDITTDLTQGLSSPTIVPTGIAADNFYDTYITFYTTGTLISSPALASGLLQYYSDYLYAYSPNSATTPANIVWPSTAASAYSVYTDVVWDQNEAWVLASPVPTLTGFSTFTNTGTADVLTFDDYLNYLTDYATHSYDSVPPVSGSTLYLPNRVAGPIQGNLLYVSQADFSTGPIAASTGAVIASTLSSVNLRLATGSVTDLP